MLGFVVKLGESVNLWVGERFVSIFAQAEPAQPQTLWRRLDAAMRGRLLMVLLGLVVLVIGFVFAMRLGTRWAKRQGGPARSDDARASSPTPRTEASPRPFLKPLTDEEAQLPVPRRDGH